MKAQILVVILLVGSFFVITSYSETKKIKKEKRSFELFMRQLCCDQTTELGADEVYILITGRNNFGEIFNTRIPGDQAHWDMNDGDQPTDNSSGDSHCVTNKMFFQSVIEDGETWSFNIAFMEEDGGTSKDFQEKGAIILKQIDDPYAKGAGQIIETFNKLGIFIHDTDDWMGMAGVTVSKKAGEDVRVSWTAKEGVLNMQRDPDDKNNERKVELRMNHDGSNYVAWVGIYRSL